jgi:hypothetical protein
MQASALIYTGQIVSTLIGNDIMTKAISDSASTIYNLLYGFVDISDPLLEQTLDELDVKEQIRSVENIITQVTSDHDSSAVQISLEQLHEIICRIREDLRQIKDNHDYHKQRYFYQYRRPDNRVQINNLKKHKTILDQRLDMLMRVFQIESQRLALPKSPNTKNVTGKHRRLTNKIKSQLQKMDNNTNTDKESNLQN